MKARTQSLGQNQYLEHSRYSISSDKPTNHQPTQVQPSSFQYCHTLLPMPHAPSNCSGRVHSSILQVGNWLRNGESLWTAILKVCSRGTSQEAVNPAAVLSSFHWLHHTPSASQRHVHHRPCLQGATVLGAKAVAKGSQNTSGARLIVARYRFLAETKWSD